MRTEKQDKLYEQAIIALHDGDYEYTIRILERLARKKHARACNELGVIYAKPVFGPKNLKKAEKYFLIAREQGNKRASYNLALLYLEGDNRSGIRKDPTKSIQDYASEAVGEVPSAKYYASTSVRDLSIEELRKCADNIPDAKYHYAMATLSSDRTNAIKLLKKASESGHVLAQYEIAKRYEMNLDGFEKDIDKAIQMYSKIKNAYPPASYRLALLLKAKGGATNDEIVECFRLSANLDYCYIPGMVAYAEILQKGLYGVNKNSEEAKKYINKIIDYGTAKETFDILEMINNREKRKEILGKSADKGYLPAIIEYAKLLDKRNSEDSFPYYLKGANMGNTDSQYEVGRRYIEGIGVSKDRNKGIFFLEKASESHHRKASALLGKILIDDKDPDSRNRGYELLDQEKELIPENYYYLGKRYLELFDETNDSTYSSKAERYLLSAVNRKIPLAFYELGKYYFYVTRDLDKGIKYLKDAEKEGILEANCLLAQILFDMKKYQEAKQYISPALNAGNPDAEYIYGKILLIEGNEEGKRYIEISARKGVEKGKIEYLSFGEDADFILTIIKELAKKGDITAIKRYIGILKNDKSARATKDLVYYLTKLSENGDQDSILELAQMYESGDRVPADPFKAKALFEKSATKEGYLKLAEYYEFGIATEANIEKAVELYEKSAKEGSIESARLCVSFALDGYGSVPPNKRKAMDYLKILEESGDINASFTLYTLLKDTNVEEAIEKLSISAEKGLLKAKIIYASYLIKKNEQPELALLYIRECIGKKMPEAYYLMGYCYEKGILLAMDRKKAFENYLKGAKKGNLASIKKVYHCYSNGIGITANEEKASAWRLRCDLPEEENLYV